MPTRKRKIISKERYFLLMENFNELSFNEKELPVEHFNEINNPEELYCLAHFHNWDDGTELLNLIVQSEYCDEGTAKMIFWRAQPDYYQAFSTAEEAEYDADVYKLLRLILKNFENGMYSKKELHFNPKTDDGSPSDLSDAENAKWKIPKMLREETKGFDVVVK